MKRLAVFSMLALSAVARAEDTADKATIVERVAAVVNETIILESEVLQRATPQLAELDQLADAHEKQRQYHAIARGTTEAMVDEELVLQAAVEAKLEATDEEINKALDEVKKQNKVNDAQLEQALAQQGYTIAEYKMDVRRQILRLRAINVLVRPRVSVSDEEVRTRYEKLSGQSSGVTEVHIRHILVGLPERPTPDEMDKARRRASEVVSRARAGEDFAGLAKQQSEDTQTKGSGGDLGWYKRGELPTEWEEILFAMGQGEVRGPVRGPRGLHVFQVIENKKESIRPFAEVKEELRQTIYNEDLDRATKMWLQELRKKAHVDIKM